MYAGNVLYAKVSKKRCMILNQGLCESFFGAINFCIEHFIWGGKCFTAEAACSNGSIGSVIVDKMGLGNTALPICGHSLKFTPAFQVSVTGAICHTNNKTTFYLSTPNFKTTASLTIHILLMELKKLYEANDSKPLSKVYIEIDGAGDNTAKAVHGFAEHMIVKKFTSLLIICRLPVGHTHKDIDSR